MALCYSLRRRRCGCWRLFCAFGGALDVAGAEPGAEFVGVAGVFVVHDGVEVFDLFHAGSDEASDGAGALDAAFAAAFLIVFGAVNGLTVGQEVLGKGGGKFFGDKLGDEGGLGRLRRGIVAGLDDEVREDGVGSGDDGAFVGAGRGTEVVVEAGFVLRDGGGGAGDVEDIETEGVEEDFLGGGATGFLAGLGSVEVFDDFGELGKPCDGVAVGREVGGISFAEGAYAAKHVVASGFTVVHSFVPFYNDPGVIVRNRLPGRVEKRVRCFKKKPGPQMFRLCSGLREVGRAVPARRRTEVTSAARWDTAPYQLPITSSCSCASVKRKFPQTALDTSAATTARWRVPV